MRRVTFAFIRQICSLLDSPFSQEEEEERKHKVLAGAMGGSTQHHGAQPRK